MKLSKSKLLLAAIVLGLAGGQACAQTSRGNQAKIAKNSVGASTSTRQGGTDENIAAQRAAVPFMFGMFDARKPKPAELTEEQLKHDEKLAALSKRKPFNIPDRYKQRTVSFSGYKPGTIVIDTKAKYLYFVQSPVAAIRYGVAVGKEGLLFTGKVKVGAKQVWPRWTPTKEMIKRSPRHYARYAKGMDGGPRNPLGARAIYLYQGRQDTYLRIHGTNQPQTIGSASSNGCFRMFNAQVMDLFDRVKLGAEVVVR